MVKPHALQMREVVIVAASLSVTHAEQTGTVLFVGQHGLESINASPNAVAHLLQCPLRKRSGRLN
jgi:hypothetical protein